MPLAATLSGDSSAVERMRGLLIGAILAGLLFSLAGFWLGVAAMAGVPPGELSISLVMAMLDGTSVGGATALRIGTLAICLGLILSSEPLRRALLVPFGGIATATLAWAGHAAGSEGLAGSARLGGDILHLLAAMGWVGALMWFALLLWRPGAWAAPQSTLRALANFALVGSLIVAILAVTGAANLLFLTPLVEWPALTGTPYGRWLAVKVALFAVMLGLATANRFWLVPSLAQVPDERRRATVRGRLRASVSLELFAALALLGVVSGLGLLDPGG